MEFLDGAESAGLAHAELEDRLRTDGFELLRLLFQDHLDLRADREQRVDAVVGADGVRRGWVETGHSRPLITLFGSVRVRRLAYRAKGAANLYLTSAELEHTRGSDSGCELGFWARRGWGVVLLRGGGWGGYLAMGVKSK